MKFDLNIKQVSNGYIITDNEDIEHLFEDTSNIDVNKDHVISMLYEILSYFGEGGSRYDKKRIQINYEPGDKYEGEER